jgi:hypothetical protein
MPFIRAESLRAPVLKSLQLLNQIGRSVPGSDRRIPDGLNRTSMARAARQSIAMSVFHDLRRRRMLFREPVRRIVQVDRSGTWKGSGASWKVRGPAGSAGSAPLMTANAQSGSLRVGT